MISELNKVMSSVTPLCCSCILCKKETSNLGIQTHYKRSHGSIEDKSVWNKSSIVLSLAKENRMKKYLSNPNYCKECQQILPYPGTKKFCSSSCSGIHSNRVRIEQGYTMPKESRRSISNKLSKPKLIIGPYTKIYILTCKFCKLNFISQKSQVRVCKTCQPLKYNNNKDKWSFKFNIFDYPDLFDLEQLKNIGWCSFGGKRGGSKNLNGLSRDHKVSVNEAKINNYDPYYISHPCNCELMPMSNNNKKKTKSSLTYQELVDIVIAYDSTRGDH